MKREQTKQYYLSRLEVEKTSSRADNKGQITNTLKVWANCKGQMKAKSLDIVTDLENNPLPTNYKYYYLGVEIRLMYYIYYNRIENLTREELKQLYNDIIEQPQKIQVIK